MGEEAFKSHLLKTSHHLFKPLLVQLGRTLHPCDALENLAIRFLIEVEVLLCNMDKDLLFATDRHIAIITQIGEKMEI